MKILATIFAALAAVGFAVSIWLIFVVTPVQYTPGSGSSLFFNQKIFYFHVANAFMMFLAVFVCGISSLVFLKNRRPNWDDYARAAGELAVVFGLVVLVTGSLWAKAAWDVWWRWEKRLTMSLLLWLTFVGYIMIRRFAGHMGDRLGAGMAVFGTVGVPFIYTMVERSDSHPQAGANGVALSLTGNMRLAFWLSVLSFLCWFIALLLTRVAAVRLERRAHQLREQALDAGVL